jgi:hypothetical protein
MSCDFLLPKYKKIAYFFINIFSFYTKNKSIVNLMFKNNVSNMRIDLEYLSLDESEVHAKAMAVLGVE